jgi:hypothetical protein
VGEAQELVSLVMKKKVEVEDKVVEGVAQVLADWEKSMEVVEVWELMMDLYYHH